MRERGEGRAIDQCGLLGIREETGLVFIRLPPKAITKGCLYTAHHITHAQTHTHALAAKIRGDIFIFCNDTPLTRCVIVHALFYTAGRTWSLR